MNRQPWHFIVLADHEIKKKLSKGVFNSLLFVSPSNVLIVGMRTPSFVMEEQSNKFTISQRFLLSSGVYVCPYLEGPLYLRTLDSQIQPEMR